MCGIGVPSMASIPGLSDTGCPKQVRQTHLCMPAHLPTPVPLCPARTMLTAEPVITRLTPHPHRCRRCWRWLRGPVPRRKAAFLCSATLGPSSHGQGPAFVSFAGCLGHGNIPGISLDRSLVTAAVRGAVAGSSSVSCHVRRTSAPCLVDSSWGKFMSLNTMEAVPEAGSAGRGRWGS